MTSCLNCWSTLTLENCLKDNMHYSTENAHMNARSVYVFILYLMGQKYVRESECLQKVINMT